MSKFLYNTGDIIFFEIDEEAVRGTILKRKKFLWMNYYLIIYVVIAFDLRGTKLYSSRKVKWIRQSKIIDKI